MKRDPNMSGEQLMKMLEQAQKEAEEQLAKMTPEEREIVKAKADKLIEEERRKSRELFELIEKHGNDRAAKPAECPHCGAPMGNGERCEYCEQPY